MINKLKIYILQKKIFFKIMFTIGVLTTIKAIIKTKYKKYFKNNKTEGIPDHDWDATRYSINLEKNKMLRDNESIIMIEPETEEVKRFSSIEEMNEYNGIKVENEIFSSKDFYDFLNNKDK